MKTLCMDSAHKHLVIGLYEHDQLLAGCAKASWKKQSETIFPELIALMDQLHWSVDDLDQVVITDGPGSYTGVRIAMTIAKVLCTRKQLPLYTVSTLQLYAGMSDDAFVMLDARSARAYCGVIKQGRKEMELIMTLDEVQQYLCRHPKAVLYGDCELIDKAGSSSDFLQNFMDLRPYWNKIDQIHILTPHYLKEQSAYKVQHD